MFNNSIQYVNVIKSQHNIKVNYQILQNNKIIKNEQSIFLLDGDNLSLDTNYKLQTLEQHIPQTYITAICEDISQTIIKKDQYTPNNNTASLVFDHNHLVTVPQNIIEQYKQLFNNTDLDYLISPFTILHHAISDNLIAKSLNIFILNNTIYGVILDQDKRYTYSAIKQLTPYDDIQNSEFYNDDIVEQKLYDEIYALELNENISTITKEFYEQNSSIFIETINIFYHIKQLNDEQLNSLEENLMINLNYIDIGLDDIVMQLVKKPTIKTISFIQPRKKRSSLSFGFWIAIGLLTTLIAAGLIYFMQDNPKVAQPTKTKQPTKKVVQTIKEVSIIDHIKYNNHITNTILDIFDVIDDYSVLKELQLQKDESTFIYTFTKANSYDDIVKPKLLKIYANSENVLTSQNNNIYTAIISNANLKYTVPKNIYKPYHTKKFLTKDDSLKILKKIFNKRSSIKYIATTNSKYTTYIFNISMIIDTPQIFFDDIDKLNQQKYSIILDYPVEFSKNKNGIEVHFKIKVNQTKPITTKPKEKQIKNKTQ